MASRPLDSIRVECEAGTLGTFNTIEVVNDIMGPSRCTFDIGDDGSFDTLEAMVAHGKRFKVYLNDQLRMSGRVIDNGIPGSAERGTTVNVTIQTILGDAAYASADPKTRVEKTSIKDFILALFAPLGLTAKDFVFKANLERDLMTGVGTKGEKPPAALEPIKVDACKVNAPETILEAAARHLRRYGLLIWDAPDGKIYIGAPDDKQQPLYRFQRLRWPNSNGNNLSDRNRIADWSDVPSVVQIFGGQAGKDLTKAPIKASSGWPDVAAQFFRPVIIGNEAVKNQAQADATARRERANRSLRKDAWELTVDDWSFWTGDRAIPYATNTTADVDVDGAGVKRGKYYITRVGVRMSAADSRTAQLGLVAPGILEV